MAKNRSKKEEKVVFVAANYEPLHDGELQEIAEALEIRLRKVLPRPELIERIVKEMNK